MSINSPEIDEIDRKIIGILQANAQMTNAQLGESIGLSASAVNERIRKLKDKNVIKQIVALIDAKSVHKELCAFIYVLVDRPEHSVEFLKNTVANADILECHHMTGEYSYLLKVRVANTLALEVFITHFLKAQKGVTKTLTQIVLSSAKDGTTIVD